MSQQLCNCAVCCFLRDAPGQLNSCKLIDLRLRPRLCGICVNSVPTAEVNGGWRYPIRNRSQPGHIQEIPRSRRICKTGYGRHMRFGSDDTRLVFPAGYSSDSSSERCLTSLRDGYISGLSAEISRPSSRKLVKSRGNPEEGGMLDGFCVCLSPGRAKRPQGPRPP